jgi:hypothetical protein
MKMDVNEGPLLIKDAVDGGLSVVSRPLLKEN